MTKEEVIAVIEACAAERDGQVDGTDFTVDEGPFEESSRKYLAFIPGNYKGPADDFFFDTPEEFLDGFIINGHPIGEQLDQITDFHVILF